MQFLRDFLYYILNDREAAIEFVRLVLALTITGHVLSWWLMKKHRWWRKPYWKFLKGVVRNPFHVFFFMTPASVVTAFIMACSDGAGDTPSAK